MNPLSRRKATAHFAPKKRNGNQKENTTELRKLNDRLDKLLAGPDDLSPSSKFFSRAGGGSGGVGGGTGSGTGAGPAGGSGYGAGAGIGPGGNGVAGAAAAMMGRAVLVLVLAHRRMVSVLAVDILVRLAGRIYRIASQRMPLLERWG